MIDPSEDNCKELKNKANAFLDALRDFEDCARAQGELQEFQDALSEAEAGIDSIEC